MKLFSSGKFILIFLIGAMLCFFAGCEIFKGKKVNITNGDGSDYSFGEIGLQLPYDNSNEKPLFLEFDFTVEGQNIEYSKAFNGHSGDTFVIEDLCPGKYKIDFKAKNAATGEDLYTGDSKVTVYKRIISPVNLNLIAIEKPAVVEEHFVDYLIADTPVFLDF